MYYAKMKAKNDISVVFQSGLFLGHGLSMEGLIRFSLNYQIMAHLQIHNPIIDYVFGYHFVALFYCRA